MNHLTLITSLIVAFIAARLLFRIMFDGWNDFWECLRFSLTPDLFSLFRGEFFEDMAKSFKLSMFFILVGVSGVATYHGIDSVIHRNATQQADEHREPTSERQDG